MIVHFVFNEIIKRLLVFMPLNGGCGLTTNYTTFKEFVLFVS